MKNHRNTKLKKPYAKSFSILFGGEIVSYSPRANKVAIGLDSVTIPSKEMQDLIETDDNYGLRFTRAVSLYTKYSSF